MLYEIFIFGTFWFWLLSLACFIGLLWAIAEEAVGWATTVVVGFFLLLTFFGTFNVFAYIMQHPGYALTWLGVYLVGGIPWAAAKLWIWGKNLRDELEDIRDEWLAKKGVKATEMTDELVREWNSYSSPKKDFCYKIGNSDMSVTPKIRNHKAKIVAWMMYWPVSLFWTMFNDALRRLWNSLYHLVSTRFQKILDSVFKGADLQLPPASTATVSTPPASK